MPTPSKRSSSNHEVAGVPVQDDIQEGSTGTVESREKSAVGSFLRGLARRAESDASFAVHLQSALEESGLLEPLESHQPASRKPGGKSGRGKESKPAAPLDPFQVLREQGVVALRETLEKMDLEELHAIVRKYRLDPARISSRWTRNARIIDLIVDQVAAHARHGQAFSHL